MSLKKLAGALIFVGFAVFVEAYLGWGTLLAPWAALSLPVLLGAVLLTFLSYWLRAMRLYDYFRAEMRGAFAACFKLMLQHNLLNNLLPMRSGELSFPVLMARYFAVPALHSVPVLLFFRLLDLHTLGALTLLALGSYWLEGPLAVIVPLLWLSLPWLAFRAQHRLEAALRSNPSGRLRALALDALGSLPRHAEGLWRAWLWTAVNWVVKLGVFAWVLRLFADMPWQAGWTGAIAGDVTSVLPLHGLGGAGTYEAGVVAGLLPFGIEAQTALPAAINLHLFVLGATLIGGALSVLLPGAKRNG